MAITSLPEWLACRAISSWSKQYSVAEKIFKAASAAELYELILIAESGDIDDQHVALSTLEYFARAKGDARWTTARKDRLVHALRKHIVEQYPDSLARHSGSVLRIMDFTWLNEFLTGIPLDQVSEEDRPKLIYDLSNQLTEQSRERLLLMTEAGWEGASEVKWPVNVPPGGLPSQPAADEWDYNPHLSIRGPLLQSPEWKHLLKSQNPLQEILLWIDSLADSDLPDLVEAWEQDDGLDHRCAGSVFRQLGLKKDPRLGNYKDRIVRRARLLATRLFQETTLLPTEYYVIRDLDREQATDFLFACLNAEKSSLRHLQSAFAEMGTLGSPRIITRIEQLAAQGGPLAKSAATYLDERGPVTPEKIAAKSARWLKNRNPRDLRWLFFSHIEGNTRRGSSIEMILTLLGEPSKCGERFFDWQGKASAVHLYLETDKSGNLDWMKLYED
jgi:hypothetical protein